MVSLEIWLTVIRRIVVPGFKADSNLFFRPDRESLEADSNLFFQNY